jgi:predicted PurR-regulated permease PerM
VGRVVLSSAARSEVILQTLASGIIVAAAVVAVLYFGGEILKPLVVAALLSLFSHRSFGNCARGGHRACPRYCSPWS